MAHGYATPYHPILELLRDYLGIKAAQPLDEARVRWRRRSQACPPRRYAAAASGIPGSDRPGSPGARLDPAVRKVRLIELVRNIVRSGRREQPTVVLVEDLHWIDAASAEFVETMVDAVIGTTTLLLFNFRHDHAAPWMQRTHYRQISLSSLNRTEVNDLLHNLLARIPRWR